MPKIQAGLNGNFIIDGDRRQRGGYDYIFTGTGDSYLRVFPVNDTKEQGYRGKFPEEWLKGDNSPFTDVADFKAYISPFFFYENTGGGGGGITSHSQLILDDGTNPHGTTQADVGLSNVDNTSDADKPISTATQTALDGKVEEAPNDGQAYVRQSETWVTSASIGENNTASNVGTAGVGVFKQKVGVDLQFKNITSTDNKISVADDTVNNEIDLTFNASNVGTSELNNDANFITSAQAPVQPADIANFETTTELDARDTANRARANHTGTQTASTISDFDTEVSNNTDVTANTAKVSADGSVTTHSDVTSAGSGAIITTVERNNITTNNAKVSADGSVDTHSDVDTTTVLPSVGDNLQWDGNNWIPVTPVVSSPLYRHIYFAGVNAALTTIAATNTPVKIVGTTTQGAGSVGLVMNGDNQILNNSGNTITVEVRATVSYSKNAGGGGDNGFTVYINQNGANLIGSKSTSFSNNGIDTVSSPSFITSMANGDFFEVWIENLTAANDVLVSDLSLIVKQI